MNRLQRWEVEAGGDSNMRLLQKGDILQLERKGYFVVDEPYIRAGRICFLLPTAFQQAVQKCLMETPSKDFFKVYRACSRQLSGYVGSVGALPFESVSGVRLFGWDSVWTCLQSQQ